MNKETLSSYGWIIVVVLILAVMFLVAPLFGNTIKGAVKDVMNNFKDKGNSAMSEDLLNLGTLDEDNREVITNFTSSEINEDEHLYAIGATDPNYVVAKFNDDFTKAVITKNGEDSDGITKNLLSEGSLTDPEHYKQNCFYINEGTLTTIEVKNGIKKLGKNLFRDCYNLNKITIANSVVDMGIGICNGCRSLESVKLSENVEIIREGSFYSCRALKEIHIPDKVKEIHQYAFMAAGLERINLPPLLTNISYSAFESCKFVSFEVPRNIEQLGSCCFERSNTLMSIKIPKEVKYVNSDIVRGCPNVVIYCERESQPDTWASDWNVDNNQVYWGVEM